MTKGGKAKGGEGERVSQGQVRKGSYLDDLKGLWGLWKEGMRKEDKVDPHMCHRCGVAKQ